MTFEIIVLNMLYYLCDYKLVLQLRIKLKVQIVYSNLKNDSSNSF